MYPGYLGMHKHNSCPCEATCKISTLAGLLNVVQLCLLRRTCYQGGHRRDQVSKPCLPCSIKELFLGEHALPKHPFKKAANAVPLMIFWTKGQDSIQKLLLLGTRIQYVDFTQQLILVPLLLEAA
mmetsp:Transcript_27371/g.55520  ORF Transcript_27371/g.55520 Transcript_27371/m.55520 type:complete len:125 (-) Transcript_27371:124-498(-)